MPAIPNSQLIMDLLQKMSTRLDNLQEELQETKAAKAENIHPGSAPPPTTQSNAPADAPKKKRGRPPKVVEPTNPVEQRMLAMRDPKTPIDERIRMALMDGATETTEIARLIGDANQFGITRTHDALRKLHESGDVANLGGDDPIWVWRLEAGVPAALRYAYVCHLLTLRPLETKNIVKTSRMTAKEVENAIVDVRRKLGTRVVDMNPTGRTKSYMILPEGMKDPSLSRKPPGSFKNKP